MFFIDKPYFSNFLQESLLQYNIPVVTTAASQQFNLHQKTITIPEDEARKRIQISTPKLYSNSENSLAWFEENAPEAPILKAINLYKNKVSFRKKIAPLYPDFYFQEITVDKLPSLQYSELPSAFILKPSIGFFSMGVYLVDSEQSWKQTLVKVKKEMQDLAGLYPEHVLNTESFIIEECIEGEEFAIDGYFNERGEAVLLGIFQHQFAGAEDVSDRVYFTSQKLVQDHLAEFTSLCQNIGDICGTTNFPFHMEVRKNSAGVIIPIEVNPMRFGGWCTTADFTAAAFGFNPYEIYFNDKKPNWDEALKSEDNSRYCLIVLDNSTGIAEEKIVAFNYEKLLSGFSYPIELRKIDWLEYPVFGFLFAKVQDDNWQEIENILSSDLSEFIEV